MISVCPVTAADKPTPKSPKTPAVKPVVKPQDIDRQNNPPGQTDRGTGVRRW
jgi:hypothetical protein